MTEAAIYSETLQPFSPHFIQEKCGTRPGMLSNVLRVTEANRTCRYPKSSN